MSVFRGGTVAGSIRVALCDPLPLFCEGAKGAIEASGFTVETPQDLAAWLTDHAAPIVFLSLLAPSQWTMLADLCHTHPSAIIVAVLDDASVAACTRAILSGAAAAVPRDMTPAQLRDVCDAAARGESLIPTDVLRALIKHSPRRRPDAAQPNQHELDWLRQLSQGLTIAQIADSSGYSERMMFRLLRDLYTKTGAANRTEALMHAREQGWV